MSELLTSVFVVITGVYAWITFRIMKANERTVASVREQTESLNRPYVTISGTDCSRQPDVLSANRQYGQDWRQRCAPSDRSRLFRQWEDGRTESTHTLGVPATDCGIGTGSELIFTLGSSITVFAHAADPAVTPQVFEVSAAYKVRKEPGSGDNSRGPSTVFPEYRPA